MKYFSIENVVNAYKGFQDCMTNKSWGYLALLKGCKSRIRPSVAFEVDMDVVSNFLEDIFNFSQTKKKYDSGRSLYVVFSNKWDHYFSYQGKYSPNVFDIIVWAYRRKAFHDNINEAELLQIFSEEFNIPVSVISDGFNVNPKEVHFVDTLYSESDLKVKLNQLGVNVSRDNIDARKTSVVASPGEISRGPFVQTLYAGLDITDYVLILQSDYYSLYGDRKDISSKSNNEDKQSLQQIFYGAPGTGKSHAVKTETEAWEKRGRVVRTTFHPDSDYSTFVGAYKPTTESVQRYDIYNKPMTRDGVPVMEQIITYEFVEQAFLQAYIDAWKNRDEPEFLIIEEINRGNCAQIFGDLFQLLDRGNDGYSEYAIRADKDLQKHLCKAFEDVEIADYPNVKTGKELLLPGNLYIRATMNTSDQSLFPIDSAFKRRWDWKYVPIVKGNDNGTELNWMIEVDGDLYDWWTFVQTINKHVFDTTNSEDKQLGFFFCKAMDNIISAETFVCKVIFYLWNDVFKDFGFDDKIFEDKDDNVNRKLSFDKFYMANGKINEGKIKTFLENLEMIPNEPTEENNSIVDSKTKIEVNGKTVTYINAIPYMAVEEYVRLNPHKTAQEVIAVWTPFKKYSMRTWIVCNKQDHDTMKPQYANYSYEITCADGQSLWVNKDGWMHHPKNPNLRDTIAEFIKAVNEAGLGVTITETVM